MPQSQDNVSPTTESILRLLLITADEKQKLQQEIEKLKDEIEKLQTGNKRLPAERPRDEKRKRSSSPVVKEEGNKAVRLDENVYLERGKLRWPSNRLIFGEVMSEDTVRPWEAEVQAEKRRLFGERVELYE